MPVGAIIGGVASVAGGLIASKGAKSAANKAADTSLATAQQNNALARDTYGQNQAALSPYMQRGNAAGSQMNALLGLGGTGPQVGGQSLPAPQPNAMTQFYGPPGAIGGWNAGGRENFGNAPVAMSEGAYPAWGAAPQASMPPQTGFGGQTAQQAANNAFDIFRNSTGYQFRLGEGMNALNSGWAGAGTLQSGAAMKAANEYGQNFASNEFGNYMNYLGNQQGVGLAGASALAGVGQNYVNTISNNNNAAGTAAANAQLIAGQNNPFANALGMVGGYFLNR